MVVCPQCHAGNSPRSRYCIQCGGSLQPAVSAPTEELPPTTKDVHQSPGACDATSHFPHPQPSTESSAWTPPPVAPSFPVTPPPSASEFTALAQHDTLGAISAANLDQAERLTVPHLSDPDSPVALSLNFHRVFVAGHCTTAEWQIENRSDQLLQRVELSLESRGLSQPGRSRVASLPPGKSIRQLIEVDPSKPGNFILSCAIGYELAGQRQRRSGTCPLRINETPGTNININITDIQSNHATGSNAGLGAEMGSVNISNLVDGKAVRTLNDLLQLEIPDLFQQVALSLDFELSVASQIYAEQQRSHSLSIPREMVGCAQAGTLLRLVPVEGSSALPVDFVARPRFRLGRARQEADWVAWVLPRTPENDEKTRRISKVHTVFEATPAGIQIADGGSANGTALDGQTLSSGSRVPFSGHARLKLAGVYPLEAEHLGADASRSLDIDNLALWVGPAAAPVVPAAGAVRFTPAPPMPAVHAAVWLLSEASFGSSRSNAWTVTGVAEIQGRFYHHRGCFWLKDEAPNDWVKINNTSISPSHIIPLVNGQRLRVGAAEFQVEIHP